MFDYLLARKILLPGLMPVCPHCALPSWLPIGEVHAECVCEYCGGTYAVGPLLRGIGDWRFRLTGLFGQEGHQEGAMAAVLALMQLHRLCARTAPFSHCTALDLSWPSGSCESDLVAVGRDVDGRPSVLIGECKAHTEIEDEQVAGLEAVRGMLAARDIQCYVAFVKTAERFNDRELARFRRLRGKGIPLILFTQRELQRYFPYLGDEEGGDVPRFKHPHSFDRIAANSYPRYLQASPPDG